MKIGIEIEGIINLARVDVDIGEYHDGIPCGDYWVCESDSSLSTSGEFKAEIPVEFVSNILKNRKQLNQAMKEFRVILNIRKSQRLSKSIYFNKSCGCHVHVSFRNYNFWRKAHPSIFIKTRKYFETNVNKLNLSNKLKEDILTQYNRSYSSVVNEKDIRSFRRDVEFNFSSERDGKGIEWRSFNLLGVSTWKELKTLINLMYKTLRFLEKQTKYWKDSETSNIEYEHIPVVKKYNNLDIIKREKPKQINEDIQLNKQKINNYTTVVSDLCNNTDCRLCYNITR